MPLKTKNYIVVCILTAAATAAVVLFVPGLSDDLEVRMLSFLTTITRT